MKLSSYCGALFLALACVPCRAAVSMRVPGVNAGAVRIITPVPAISLKLSPVTTHAELRDSFMALTGRVASLASSIDGFADHVHPLLAAGGALYAIGSPKGVAVFSPDPSGPALLFKSPADLDPRFKAKALPKKLERALRAAIDRDDVLKAERILAAYFDNLRR